MRGKPMTGQGQSTAIKADVSAGLFDILLVFMFNRLGRKEDETPLGCTRERMFF
jgi:hypothetical protein